ncbi:PaaI family thioesterase [Neobacillus niacini]|uniref:PaaI family thioesterase n=1 Tax=Neobacillus niacini TaxID=86668 RepID=UPI002FFDD8F5
MKTNYSLENYKIKNSKLMEEEASYIRQHVEDSIQKTKENGIHFFGNFIGMNFLGFKGDVFISEVEAKPHLLNTFQVLQGGAQTTISDVTMGFMLLQLYGDVVTLEMKTNFISPGSGKVFQAKSKVVGKAGRHILCECRLENEEGILISYSTGTFVQRNQNKS